MYNVTWYEAGEFCEKLNEISKKNGLLPDGYAFALPTESQWEYACRATDTNIVYQANIFSPVEFAIMGEECNDLDYIAWYQFNSYKGYVGNGFDTRQYWATSLPRPLNPKISGVRKVMRKIPEQLQIVESAGQSTCAFYVMRA